jgi:hypothetical protein
MHQLAKLGFGGLLESFLLLFHPFRGRFALFLGKLL